MTDSTWDHLPDLSDHGYRLNRVVDHDPHQGSTLYTAQMLASRAQSLGLMEKSSDRRGRGFLKAMQELDWKKTVLVKRLELIETGLDWSQQADVKQGWQLWQELDHPGIPHYLDQFETHEGLYLVCQNPKAQLLNTRQSFSANEIKQITIAVLEILVYLQSRFPPLVHQNINPNNLLIDEQNQVYLLGSNFAAIRMGTETFPSLILPLPGFAAPEQLSRDPLTLASDLYGLGVTLLCLITGTPTDQADRLRYDGQNFDVKSLASWLSPQFARWLQRMVALNPRRRFPHAAAALKAVQGVDLDLATADRPPLWRKAVVVPAMAAIGVVLGVAALLETRSPQEANLAPTPSPAAIQTPTPTNSPAASPAPSTPTDQGSNLDPAALNRIGDQLRKEKSYEAALELYDQALTKDPDNYHAWFYKGFCLSRLNRHEAALTVYDRALELDPEDHALWHNRGWSLRQLEREEESLVAFERALAIKPDYQPSLFQKGRLLTYFERYEEALATYDQLLTLNPKYESALTNRGMVLSRLQRYQEALEPLERAIALNANNKIAWNNKGWVLYKMDRYDEAIAAYDEALRIDPNYTLAKNNRETAFEASGGDR